MPPLTDEQKRWLKQRVHHLKPVVTVGQHGVSAAVIAEIGTALTHHELIKVRINGADRDERDTMIAHIAQETGAHLIHRIGHVAAYYRANPKKPEPLWPPNG